MDNLQPFQDSQQNQEPELTIHDYWVIINRGKLWIIISSIVMLALSVYYSYSVSPVYTATATLLIDKSSDSGAIFDFGRGMNQSEISNQIELLQSRQVATSTVKNLWNSAHRNHLAIFGTNKYKPRGQRLRKFVMEIITLGLYDPETARSNRSNHFKEEYTENIGLIFSKGIQESIQVVNKRGTDVLTLSAKSSFPDEAALLANTVAKEFVQLDRKWGADQTINLLLFLEDQLQLKGKELSSAEEKVKTYMESEKIFDLTGNAGILLGQITAVESQYYETVAEININKENIRYIKGKLSDEEKQLASQLKNSINAKVFALRKEIGAREAEFIRNESLYGPEHDAVKTAKKQISALKNKLDNETNDLISRGLSVADPIEYRNELINELISADAILASSHTKAEEYSKLIEKYNTQIASLPKKQMEYARLERDRSVLSETYLFMRQKLEEVRVNVASEGGKVQIIDKAIVPENASKPNKKKNMLFGLFFGAILGTSFIFLRDYLDRTIQSIEWIERFGVTVLGVIPVVTGIEMKQNIVKRRKKQNRGVSESNTLQRYLITREEPKSPISESYRTLRTNILYSQADKKIKSILVSSPSPGEGKTTTVANLSITFANMGKRTLLLDTDLRRPVIHRVFGLKKEPGISHYLSENLEDFDSLIQQTDVENLWVVPAGVTPPNPSELMGSKKMAKLIDRLEKEWDIILLDSPPLVAVTDASMISKAIDAMIMVVKAAETDREAFRRAIKSLIAIQVPLSGVVVNGISRRTSKDTYYYYYQYYQHYYGGYYDQEKKEIGEKA